MSLNVINVNFSNVMVFMWIVFASHSGTISKYAGEKDTPLNVSVTLTVKKLILSLTLSRFEKWQHGNQKSRFHHGRNLKPGSNACRLNSLPFLLLKLFLLNRENLVHIASHFLQAIYGCCCSQYLYYSICKTS